MYNAYENCNSKFYYTYLSNYEHYFHHHHHHTILCAVLFFQLPQLC